MNRGGVGARSLNVELQKALNPAGERKVERFGATYAAGDKVMQIQNDYDKEVYNGDIGYVTDVDPDAGELAADFDGRAVKYGFGELDTLVPAYAVTIHKSQGSEYPAVVIPLLIAALSDAAAQPALHRHYAGQASRGAGRAAEGGGDRGAQRHRAAALVAAARLARANPAGPIVGWAKRSVPTILRAASQVRVGTLRFAHPTICW